MGSSRCIASCPGVAARPAKNGDNPALVGGVGCGRDAERSVIKVSPGSFGRSWESSSQRVALSHAPPHSAHSRLPLLRLSLSLSPPRVALSHAPLTALTRDSPSSDSLSLSPAQVRVARRAGPAQRARHAAGVPRGRGAAPALPAALPPVERHVQARPHGDTPRRLPARVVGVALGRTLPLRSGNSPLWLSAKLWRVLSTRVRKGYMGKNCLHVYSEVPINLVPPPSHPLREKRADELTGTYLFLPGDVGGRLRTHYRLHERCAAGALPTGRRSPVVRALRLSLPRPTRCAPLPPPLSPGKECTHYTDAMLRDYATI
jgi:hypothetical protein